MEQDQFEALTLDQLEALPILEELKALFQKPDDGLFMDAKGVWWMTGWLEGKRYRRLFRMGGTE